MEYGTEYICESINQEMIIVKSRQVMEMTSYKADILRPQYCSLASTSVLGAEDMPGGSECIPHRSSWRLQLRLPGRSVLLLTAITAAP